MRKYVIGLGLVLIAIHNAGQPLLSYLFLPWIGIMLLVGGIISVPTKRLKASGLGSKWVWIPLLILAFAIIASGIAQYVRGEVTLAKGLAPIASVIIWYGLYLVTRIDGEGIGRPIAAAVIVEALSITVLAFISNGVRGGGLVSPTNYDISTAFLVFGTFLSPRKWQWWLSAIALVGLFFSGAEEGAVAVGSIVLVFLIVRDWSPRAWLPVWALMLAFLIATPLGITQNLYYPADKEVKYGDNPSTLNKVQAVELAWQNKGNSVEFNKYMDIATGYRWSTHWRIHPIKLFGYGYNLTNFYPGIPHNIFLIIIEQVGPIGLLAWLTVTAYCIKTSKRWYLWASVIGLGMFDHYTWTQIAPWWWAMVGISENHRLATPNIFKEAAI